MKKIERRLASPRANFVTGHRLSDAAKRQLSSAPSGAWFRLLPAILGLFALLASISAISAISAVDGDCGNLVQLHVHRHRDPGPHVRSRLWCAHFPHHQRRHGRSRRHAADRDDVIRVQRRRQQRDPSHATAGPFNVNVSAATTAPLFTTDSPPLTATVGALYSYGFQATGTPTPTYALDAGAPSFLTINATTGAVAGTPPTGTTSFTYSVTASNGKLPNATTGLFTVAVATPSTAPAFTADTPPLTAAPGALYSYKFVATGTPAPTYSLSTAVSWLSINSATGLVSGTVPSTYTGTFLYSVKATNSVNSATAGPFTVTVSTASATPVFIAEARR